MKMARPAKEGVWNFISLMNDIAQDLLDILKCPHCPLGKLSADGNGTLKCTVCSRVYPIIDGWPDLLPNSGVLPADKPSEEVKG